MEGALRFTSLAVTEGHVFGLTADGKVYELLGFGKPEGWRPVPMEILKDKKLGAF